VDGGSGSDVSDKTLHIYWERSSSDFVEGELKVNQSSHNEIIHTDLQNLLSHKISERGTVVTLYNDAVGLHLYNHHHHRIQCALESVTCFYQGE
jgi:hypothetical protein